MMSTRTMTETLSNLRSDFRKWFDVGRTEYGTLAYRVFWHADSHVSQYIAYRLASDVEDEVVMLADEETFAVNVKWDGCSNIMGDNPIHTCSREDLAAIGVLLTACYDHAGRSMSSALLDAFGALRTYRAIVAEIEDAQARADAAWLLLSDEDRAEANRG